MQLPEITLLEIVLRNTELLATEYKLYQLKDFYRAKANKLLPIENKFDNGLGFTKILMPTVDQKKFEQLIDIYSN
jgi:hypothetical protein